jgi:hypothetical protein
LAANLFWETWEHSYYCPIPLAVAENTHVESVVYRQVAGHSKLAVERSMLEEADIGAVEDWLVQDSNIRLPLPAV